MPCFILQQVRLSHLLCTLRGHAFYPIYRRTLALEPPIVLHKPLPIALIRIFLTLKAWLFSQLKLETHVLGVTLFQVCFKLLELGLIFVVLGRSLGHSLQATLKAALMLFCLLHHSLYLGLFFHFLFQRSQLSIQPNMLLYDAYGLFEIIFKALAFHCNLQLQTALQLKHVHRPNARTLQARRALWWGRVEKDSQIATTNIYSCYYKNDRGQRGRWDE
ncbi:hypothetical protein FGO68_gene6028 [Halteria grandinella]|uniref:Uncharacterized protein n=1 Tax=Halteria grandinella TaxID=5974 RepID=A0A8J8NPY6_HALGN|nr:hypothetical protein FGO68_gene6028 [Halteria grandinella]